MGVSTDAILCYGFLVGDEGGGYEGLEWLPEDQYGEQMGFEEFVAGLYGLAKPAEFLDRSVAERFAYYDKKRVLLAGVGVQLVSHCSDQYPMFVLAAKKSWSVANRGLPKELGQWVGGKIEEALTVQDEWTAQLRDFCEKAGIPFVEPQWILCSTWG